MDPSQTRSSDSPPESWDRSGLPVWSYLSEEFLEVEKDVLFRRHWQLVCHVNDLPEHGDYMALDVVSERALVVRGRDGAVRAFHNVCRHRGSRVVAHDKGHCSSAIVCPFHGWTYNLDGTLRGAAQPQSLPKLDLIEFGLPPLEMEIWHGFVFVRFKPGPQPAISDIMGRFEDELAPYELSTLLPAISRPWTETSEVNWKSVRDVDNEGYHVPMAHPGLHELFGGNYFDEPYTSGTARSFSTFSDAPGQLWSVRAYKNLLPDQDWLPKSHRRAWLYIGVFPNFVFSLYPDSVNFYQEFPLSVGRTLLRSVTYRRPNECRNLKAARYLSGRIDQITSEEDQLLTVWSYEAAHSSGFKGIILSDREYGVRSYHDHLRSVLPVLNDQTPPEPGEVAARNALLQSADGPAP